MNRISLVVFLGNYGDKYKNTRHNVAWQFCDSLSFADNLVWHEKFKGHYALYEFDKYGEKQQVWFLKPDTFMNLSGESILALAQFFKIEPAEILVCHDELELPIGTFSLKWSGGLAGHNGLRSTKENLGTADFWRLRFGISKPAGANIADYVLSDFKGDEAITMSLVYDKAAELFCRALLASEPSRLLPQWAKVKID